MNRRGTRRKVPGRRHRTAFSPRPTDPVRWPGFYSSREEQAGARADRVGATHHVAVPLPVHRQGGGAQIHAGRHGEGRMVVIPRHRARGCRPSGARGRSPGIRPAGTAGPVASTTSLAPGGGIGYNRAKAGRHPPWPTSLSRPTNARPACSVSNFVPASASRSVRPSTAADFIPPPLLPLSVARAVASAHSCARMSASPCGALRP
jgi:hypothetical protein